MAETKSGSYLKGLRVLAVDDEQDILDTLEDVLDEAKVDQAKDFESAQRKLKETKYDLVILDIMGVNGFVLLAEAAVRGIPTVMLTAHSFNPPSLKDSIESGAIAYLPKEELSNLNELLGEILAIHQRGESTWKHLFQRLENFFDKSFGQDWMKDDQDFWNNYWPPMY